MNRRIIPLEVTLILLQLAFIYYYWDAIPDRIPRHYNLQGEPDAWAGKSFMFFYPGLLVFMSAVMHVTHWFARESFEESGGRRIFVTLHIGSVLLPVVLMAWSTLPHTSVTLPDGFSIMAILYYFNVIILLVLGNYLPKLQPNGAIGLRTPWTLSSDVVWRRSHRFASRVFFGAGLLLLAIGWSLPRVMLIPVSVGAIMVASIVAIVVSWRYAQAEAAGSDNSATSSDPAV